MFQLLLQALPSIPTDSIPSPREELRMLSAMSLDDIISKVANTMISFAASLAIAIVVFYVGKFIIKKIYNITLSVLVRRQVDRSLSTFILSLIRMVLYFILIVTVIGILGIETSSFLALFASAGVAIGMALSGTLQNFAGGVLILLLKPYKIGDYIEAQGYAGTVTEIQIFSTIICTPDNKSIIIPNGGLSTGSINNWSREDYRRIEWTVCLGYGDDFEKARETLLGMLDEDNRVVKRYIEQDREERIEAEISSRGEQPVQEPVKRGFFYRLFHKTRKAGAAPSADVWAETDRMKNRVLVPKVDRSPSVNLGNLADSSIELTVRAWVRSGDYWPVFYSFNERVYKEMPARGFSFPFPQMDVHLKQALS